MNEKPKLPQRFKKSMIVRKSAGNSTKYYGLALATVTKHKFITFNKFYP